MKGKLVLILLVIGALLLAAWVGQGALQAASRDETPEVLSEPDTSDESDVAEKSEFESLIEALRAAGFKVEIEGAIEDPLFTGTGKAIEVNGQYVQVFEFEGEAAAVEGAGTVSGGGTIIGTSIVDWIETPHFYQAGALVVLYAGSEEAVLSGLQDALGEPFLVGVSMGLPPVGV
jgi:hypothetical protein